MEQSRGEALITISYCIMFDVHPPECSSTVRGLRAVSSDRRLARLIQEYRASH